MDQTKMETAEKLFMSCQFDKAFPILEELAKENDLRKLVIESNSRALFFLGLLYRYGLGHVQRDEEKSQDALGKSVIRGEPAAWL